MKANESNLDRIIRVIAAAVLVYAGLQMSGALGTVLLVVAVVFAVTAAVGFCPLYSLFKFSTKK